MNATSNVHHCFSGVWQNLVVEAPFENQVGWGTWPHYLTHLSLTILLELLLVVWIWEIILQYHGQIICHIYIHIQLLSFIWPACLWPSCSTYWWSLLTLLTCPSSSCPGSPMDNHSWKMEPLNSWGGTDLKHLILIVSKKYKKCWKTWIQLLVTLLTVPRFVVNGFMAKHLKHQKKTWFCR